MTTISIKNELQNIADHLPEDASFRDVMYQLYVRMKISEGKKAAECGDVLSHSEVKKQFLK